MKIASFWLCALVGLIPTITSVALASNSNNHFRNDLRTTTSLLASSSSDAKNNMAVFGGRLHVPPGGAIKPKSPRREGMSGSSTETYATAVGLEASVMEGIVAEKRPLRVLFLSADTGGGHRASAEALAKQFLIQYPGSTYELADLWTDHGVMPYRTLVNAYKHMSAHPNQWRIFYHLSNTKLNEVFSNLHSKWTCGGRIKKRIESHDPDVIVSVHPTMNHAPLIETQHISKELGKHIPFFTVVTDLGSGHSMWFEKNVNKLYVASDRLYRLARRRGGTSKQKIFMTGLPIRHGFAVQAEQLGDRTTAEGKEYQRKMRTELGLVGDKPMVLVMGGGEGVGSLSDIVNSLYAELSQIGVDATICVVCGRNEKLKVDLETRDFDQVAAEIDNKGKRRSLFSRFRRNKRKNAPEEIEHEAAPRKGKIDVVPLGFITSMPEYMVAADVLVSKAGPGTIAEAASVGLPVMMTSFLPGQEAGNVDVVLESGFGEYKKRPSEIAKVVGAWLTDCALLNSLSRAATKAGNPYAADEIVADIGQQTIAWMNLNEQ